MRGATYFALGQQKTKNPLLTPPARESFFRPLKTSLKLLFQ
jgi:hypothetical protein